VALIDPESDALVIRIVYDGPPMVGKTTSVQRLASGLGGNVVIPEEVNGRTVFFDWLDYTGGLFEGRRIRCQIVSVPGQASLASRRRHLLESADVVVFVADSTRAELDIAKKYLDGLRSVLERSGKTAVGIVLQANKRDHEEAVPITELRDLLGTADSRVAIVESVATDGLGVREAFVLAVRLALDRVRELMRLNLLQMAKPEIDSAEDLLSELTGKEHGSLALATEFGLTHTRLAEVQSRPLAATALESVLRPTHHSNPPTPSPPESVAPALPGGDVASGMIWPPVDGRLILHEAGLTPNLLTCDKTGNWFATDGSKWTLHSHAEARFDAINAGRQALVAWARMHVASLNHISRRRCIVLSEDGSSGYRLWQLHARESSIIDQFTPSLRISPEAMTTSLSELIERVFGLSALCSKTAPGIHITPATTSVDPSGPRFSGNMPHPAAETIAPIAQSESSLLREIASDLSFALPDMVRSGRAMLELLDAHAAESRSDSIRLTRRFVRRYVVT
jgi:signal recognition particle receptor subunit beta